MVIVFCWELDSVHMQFCWGDLGLIEFATSQCAWDLFERLIALLERQEF